MKRKIYFAGSIRGGREDADLYRRLIEALAGKGEVLTEHVGSPQLEELEKDMDDGAIYRADVERIRACDLVVAECTRPSLGVGYELAFAEAAGKPCAVLYRPEETRLSAMVAGDPHFTLFPYRREEDAASLIDRVLREMSPRLPDTGEQ